MHLTPTVNKHHTQVASDNLGLSKTAYLNFHQHFYLAQICLGHVAKSMLLLFLSSLQLIVVVMIL